MKISDISNEYNQPALHKSDLASNPYDQFQSWLEDALESEVNEPTAMGLATVEDGKPSLRIVLLKGFDERGFVFFTNYESRKSTQMDANPHAALTFFWPELFQQIRIEGKVSKISEEESDAYFQSRELGSRIGAWASPQSSVLENREVLEKRVKDMEEKFKGQEKFPKPAFWGGFRVEPLMIEFWQGRESRLHDRFRYSLIAEGEWKVDRLAP